MYSRYRLTIAFVIGTLFFAQTSVVKADEAASAVEVLARGPIHEAYAEPLENQPGPGPVIAKQPPEAIDELPPDQKPEGDHVVWLPGYWSYDEERKDFIWVSGFWRATPPNRVWMPGSWRKADEGWQWVGGFWGKSTQAQAEVEYLPQPPAPLELSPATPAPTSTSIYVPGCWVYRGHYVWRPGYWIDHRPNWIWIPSHYRWTPAGYIYVDGYWDYTLQDRGILYAPAYIPSSVYIEASYRYTPMVVVREQCVFGALFVRRGWGCYYFGDYFDAGYSSQGYVSWCGYSRGADVVVVRGWYDPMYSYYQVSYRNDPTWRTGMVDLYVGRYRGDIPPPPRTLVQQNNIFINNTNIVNNTTIINNKSVNVTNVQMLTTVNQMAKVNPELKIRTLSPSERQMHMQTAREIHVSAQTRSQAESQMARTTRMPRGADAPITRKLDVPRSLVKASVVSPTRISSPTAKIDVPRNTLPVSHIESKNQLPGFRGDSSNVPQSNHALPKVSTFPTHPDLKGAQPLFDPSKNPMTLRPGPSGLLPVNPKSPPAVVTPPHNEQPKKKDRDKN